MSPARPVPLYAHSHEDRPRGQWQGLREHLETVAELAGRFAAPFGAEEFARLAGLWHDLGKAQPAFQSYISEPDSDEWAQHAIHGALLARSKATAESTSWLPLAFVVAGHHAGLANLNHSPEGGGPRPLVPRLKAAQGEHLLEALERHLPEDLAALAEHPLPELPAWMKTARSEARSKKEVKSEEERSGRCAELWIRFLFSALVDADFLDTDEFYQPGERRRALAGLVGIPELRRRLDAHVDGLAAGAPDTEVNRVRQEVLARCREAALEAPGFFSLTVPTGGGKTLAAMSFALRHAEHHAGERGDGVAGSGLRRVIVAIPYTSILEQNAKVYQRALGADQVIEHHSSLDPDEETGRNRLASENWDAPVVVTTNVQLLESLFSHRTSRCRKLHNVAGSVILLDEVQTLPPELLEATLDVLRELVARYGCTVVFSTATQPALNRRESFEEGLEGVREIVADPAAMARRLRRFEVSWPDPAAGPVEWPELAAELGGLERVLTVVHRRADARELAELLPVEGRFHLSGLMCAEHRTAVLEKVGERLAVSGALCRLVSTQLIEAGVDVDFPLVYRALGGLDSLVQAGGRCNREGRLQGLGRLVVFEAPTDPPPGAPRLGLETLRTLLASRGDTLDPLDPTVIEAYFRRLYFKQDLDGPRVQVSRARLAFADTAHRFRLIDDAWSRPLVVPYGDSAARVERLRQEGPRRETLRALQRFTVNLSVRDLDRLDQVGAVERVHEVVPVLTAPYHRMYSDEWGLVLPEDDPVADPASLVV